MRNYREEWAEGEIEARGLLDVIDDLRAKIEQMERQEPVAEWVDDTFNQYPHLKWKTPYKAIMGTKLYTKFYALPGAKGE